MIDYKGSKRRAECASGGNGLQVGQKVTVSKKIHFWEGSAGAFLPRSSPFDFGPSMFLLFVFTATNQTHCKCYHPITMKSSSNTK